MKDWNPEKAAQLFHELDAQTNQNSTNYISPETIWASAKKGAQPAPVQSNIDFGGKSYPVVKPNQFDSYSKNLKTVTSEFETQLKALDKAIQNNDIARAKSSYNDPAYAKLIDEYKVLLNKKSAITDKIKEIQKAQTSVKDTKIVNDAYSSFKDPDLENTSNKGVQTNLKGEDARIHSYINGTEEDKKKADINYLWTHRNQQNPDVVYRTMTADEIKAYNYLLGKYGIGKAKEFLNALKDTLNNRTGYNLAESIKDKPVMQQLYGIPAGIDQFQQGIQGWAGEESGPSATQYASAYNRENIDWGFNVLGSKAGQVLYDLINTTSNMAPSLMIGAINPVVGTISMGASAGGNARQSALREGFDNDQATAYGLLVGASEAYLEHLIGGFTELGGKVTQGVLKKAIMDIDSTLLRVAANTTKNMVGEFTEEYLQDVLEPVFRNIVFDEKNQIKPFSKEALYSGILGALSAGTIEGVQNAANAGFLNKLGTQLRENPEKLTTDDIILMGTMFSKDSESFQLATELQKKSLAGKDVPLDQIGDLYLSMINESSKKGKDFGNVRVEEDEDLSTGLRIRGVSEDVAKGMSKEKQKQAAEAERRAKLHKDLETFDKEHGTNIAKGFDVVGKSEYANKEAVDAILAKGDKITNYDVRMLKLAGFAGENESKADIINRIKAGTLTTKNTPIAPAPTTKPQPTGDIITDIIYGATNENTDYNVFYSNPNKLSEFLKRTGIPLNPKAEWPEIRDAIENYARQKRKNPIPRPTTALPNASNLINDIVNGRLDSESDLDQLKDPAAQKEFTDKTGVSFPPNASWAEIRKRIRDYAQTRKPSAGQPSARTDKEIVDAITSYREKNNRNITREELEQQLGKVDIDDLVARGIIGVGTKKGGLYVKRPVETSTPPSQPSAPQPTSQQPTPPSQPPATTQTPAPTPPANQQPESDLNDVINSWGRAGKAAYKKWGENEHVNADLDDITKPYTQAWIKFFDFYYKAGLKGEKPKYNERPDTGDYLIPPFLEDEAYKAGEKDALHATQPEPSQGEQLWLKYNHLIDTARPSNAIYETLKNAIDKNEITRQEVFDLLNFCAEKQILSDKRVSEIVDRLNENQSVIDLPKQPAPQQPEPKQPESQPSEQSDEITLHRLFKKYVDALSGNEKITQDLLDAINKDGVPEKQIFELFNFMRDRKLLPTNRIDEIENLLRTKLNPSAPANQPEQQPESDIVKVQDELANLFVENSYTYKDPNTGYLYIANNYFVIRASQGQINYVNRRNLGKRNGTLLKEIDLSQFVKKTDSAVLVTETPKVYEEGGAHFVYFKQGDVSAIINDNYLKWFKSEPTFYLDKLKDGKHFGLVIVNNVGNIKGFIMPLMIDPPKNVTMQDYYGITIQKPAPPAPEQPAPQNPSNEITQDEIDEVIRAGVYTPPKGYKTDKYRTYVFFNANHSLQEKADFVAKIFNHGGTESAEEKYFYDGTGLTIEKGNRKTHLTYEDVATRIDQLIKESKYLTPKELKDFSKWARDYDPKTEEIIDDSPNKGNRKIGVNREYAAQDLTPTQETQLRILDALGRKYGIKIVIEDEIRVRNGGHPVLGYYNRTTGEVHISLEKPDAIMYLAMHELTHYLKQANPDGFEKLKNFVYASLKINGMDIEARIRELLVGYTREQAEDEIVCDSVPAILTDEKSVRRLIAQDSSLVQQIMQFIDDFIKALKNIVHRVAVSIDIKEVQTLEGYTETLQRISDLFHEGMDGTQSPPEPSPPAPPAPPAPQFDNISESHAVAIKVMWKLRMGKNITADDLYGFCDEAFGGTMAEGKYDRKDAYDALELGINLYLLEKSAFTWRGIDLNAEDRQTIKANIQKLRDLLATIPTQTVKTEEQQSHQQYSTPPNIAYTANWLANIIESDIVLEPSAGIGGLALFSKANGAKVYVNELSKRRLAILQNMPFDAFFNENAEHINSILGSKFNPSVVVMNPPFSATAGRLDKNSTSNAQAHIEEALRILTPNGRLVAIVGQGMSDVNPSQAEWWKKIKTEYNVRANVGLYNSEQAGYIKHTNEYSKYGTTFGVNIVVIDKTGPTEVKSDGTFKTITGAVPTLEELVDLLWGVRNDVFDRRGIEISTSQTGRTPSNGGRTGGTNTSGGTHGGSSVPPSTNGSVDGGRGSGSSVVQRPGDVGVPDSATSNTGNESGSQDSVRPRTDTDSDGGRDELSDRGEGGSGPISVGRDSGSSADINEDSVYSPYKAQAVKFDNVQPHRAKLVESTAMASVQAPPITYKPMLEQSLIDSGTVSGEQLEPISRAGQNHQQILPNGTRKALFVGDGTGVGKGRIAAGIIRDNWNQGRKKAIWITKGPKLLVDAIRDWTALGGKASDIFVAKAKKPIERQEGILFMPYSTLATKAEPNELSRYDQLVNWFGKDYEGAIICDECHEMANSIPTKGSRGPKKAAQKAIKGVSLQDDLPKSRITYLSATGASDTNELAYLTRLGLWGDDTPFNDARDFVNSIASGGIAAMELVARDMKAMGLYIARNISYEGCEYSTLYHNLTEEQQVIYDKLSEAWQLVLSGFKSAANLTGQIHAGMGTINSQFWGAELRFFNVVLTSMQMPSVIADMKKRLAEGKACVLQIVNTGEAQEKRSAKKQIESGEPMEDMDTTPRETIIDLIKKHYPIYQYEPIVDDKGNEIWVQVFDSHGDPVINPQAVQARDDLIAHIEMIRIPASPLEILFEEFGSDKVAEVTGRNERYVWKRDVNGNPKYEREVLSDEKKEADVQRFCDDEIQILVFSDAGATGKSYHADKDFKNQRRRSHYLIQAGWRAVTAVQGFGRTHRTNESSQPEYILVSTDLKGQKRFISSIARRLDQLGALTKGQRQTGSNSIFAASDNLESREAREALALFFTDLFNGRTPFDCKELLNELGLYEKLIQNDHGQETLTNNAEDLRNTTKFMNRILILPKEKQNAVFDEFFLRVQAVVDYAIQHDTLDTGLVNIKCESAHVVSRTQVYKDKTGAITEYLEIKANKKTEPISFNTLMSYDSSDFLGLYRNKETGEVRAAMRTTDKTNTDGSIVKRFKLMTAIRGSDTRVVESTFKEKWEAVEQTEWGIEWRKVMANSPKTREETVHLLTGILLPIWDRLPPEQAKVVRITADGKSYLGRQIPMMKVDDTLKRLGVSRNATAVTPDTVWQELLNHKQIELLNSTFIKLSTVANDTRIELIGKNNYNYYMQYGRNGKLYPNTGIIAEQINGRWRHFIPYTPIGREILARIIERSPVFRIGDDPDAFSVASESLALQPKSKGKADVAAHKVNIASARAKAAQLVKNFNNLDKVTQDEIAMTVASCQTYGINPKAYANITAKLGVNIRYDNTLDTNGKYVHDSSGKYLILNPRAKNGIDWVLVHELYHDIKNTPEGQELRRIILKNASSNPLFEQARADLDSRYKRYYNDHDLDPTFDIDDEIVAEELGKALGSEDFTYELAGVKPSIWKRIIAWIDRVILKLTDTEAYDRMTRIKKLFRAALTEVESNGEHVDFATLRPEPPKVIGHGYKVLRVREPRMGDLFPMYVEWDIPTPFGVWLNAGKGKVKFDSRGRERIEADSMGTVAPRPGYHVLDFPYAPQIGKDKIGNRATKLHPFEVFCEVEYAKDVNYQAEANKAGYNPKTGNINHQLAELKGIPYDGYYRYKQATGWWNITGAMKITRILTDAEVNEILKKKGLPIMERVGGEFDFEAHGFGKDGKPMQQYIPDLEGEGAWERFIEERRFVKKQTKVKDKYAQAAMEMDKTAKEMEFSLPIPPQIHSDPEEIAYQKIKYLNDRNEGRTDSDKQKIKLLAQSSPWTPDELDRARTIIRRYVMALDAANFDEDGWTMKEAKVLLSTAKQGRTPVEWFTEGRDKLTRRFVDIGHDIYKMGKDIDDSELYMSWDLAKKSRRAAEFMLGGEQTDVYGHRTGDSFIKVFEKFDKYDKWITQNGVKKKVNPLKESFFEYLFNLHNIDRMNLINRAKELVRRELLQALPQIKNKLKDAEFEDVLNEYFDLIKDGDFDQAEWLMDQNPDAQAEFDKAAQQTRAGRRFLAIRQMASEVKNKPVFGEDVTADVSRQRAADILAAHPEFAEDAQKVYHYLQNLLQYRVDSGLISQEQADAMMDLYPHYVPTNRELNATAGLRERDSVANIANTVKKATGGFQDLMPLDMQISRMTMQVVTAARKNMFGLRLLYGSRNNRVVASKYVKSINEVALYHDIDNPLDYGAGTFVIWENGSPVEMDVSKGLFEGIKEISSIEDQWYDTMKYLIQFNNTFKALVTGYNPIFLPKNLIRDQQEAFFNSKKLSKLLLTYPKAFNEMRKNGAMWRQYKALGGFANSFFDYDKGVRNTHSFGSKLAKNTIDRVEQANFAIEQFPRFAAFIQTLEAGGSVEQAMYEASDLTVNFGRSGDLGKRINSTFVPFFNPAVQGLSKFIRRFTETKGAKQWVALTMKAALLGIAPVLLNALMGFDDDEEYKSISQRDKDVYYLFKLGKGYWARIPRGRVLSIFQNLFRRGAQAIKGEKIDWATYWNVLVENMAPENPLTSNILSPFIDASLNRTWYGKDIVPARLQQNSPNLQWDETTDAVSIWFANTGMGKLLKVSPMKMNYLFDSLTGALGDLALPLMSEQAEAGGFFSPFVRAFTVDTLISNTYSKDFYDKKTEYARIAKDEINETGVPTHAELMNRYFTKQSDAMNAIYKEMRAVQSDTKLTNEQKINKVKVFRAALNKLQKAAVDVLPRYEALISKYYNPKRVFSEEDIKIEKQKAETAYEKANREIFGAEYAISTVGKDLYKKAEESIEAGFTFEKFFDLYQDGKSVNPDLDKDGKAIEGTGKIKAAKYVLNSDMSNNQRRWAFTEYFGYSGDIVEYGKAKSTLANNEQYLSFEEKDKIAVLNKVASYFADPLNTEFEKQAAVDYSGIDVAIGQSVLSGMSRLEGEDNDKDGRADTGTVKLQKQEYLRDSGLTQVEQLLLGLIGNIGKPASQRQVNQVRNYINSLALSEAERVILYKQCGFELKNGRYVYTRHKGLS